MFSVYNVGLEFLWSPQLSSVTALSTSLEAKEDRHGVRRPVHSQPPCCLGLTVSCTPWLAMRQRGKPSAFSSDFCRFQVGEKSVKKVHKLIKIPNTGEKDSLWHTKVNFYNIYIA